MKPEQLAKVQQALDQGMTQLQAAEAAGVGLRSVSRAVNKKEVRRQPSARSGDGPANEYRRMWTTRELLDVYKQKRVPSILVSLEAQAQRGNWRIHEWVGRMREARWDPVEWRFTVAFLPILARDIESSALAELADLMRDAVPWKTKELRRRYHRLAAPIMDEALGQIANWSVHSEVLTRRYVLVEVSTGPQGEEGEAAAARSEGLGRLSQRFVGLGPTFPDYEEFEKELWNSPYGVLLRLMQRLPDVDRPQQNFPWQRKKWLRKNRKDSIAVLAALWCLNVTDEWLKIVRNENHLIWADIRSSEEVLEDEEL